MGVLVYLICIFIARCLLQLPGDKKKETRSNEELQIYIEYSAQVYVLEIPIKRYGVGELKRGGIDVSIGNKALLEKGGGRLYYHFQSSYLRIKKQTLLYYSLAKRQINDTQRIDLVAQVNEYSSINIIVRKV